MSGDDGRAQAMAARERARAARAHNTRVAGLLAGSKRRPLVEWRCRAADRGRGGCLLVRVWATPDGPLVAWSPRRRSEPVARRIDVRPQEPAGADLLADLVEAAAGAPVAGLFCCDHYEGDVRPDILIADVERARAGRQTVERVLPDDHADTVTLVGPSQ